MNPAATFKSGESEKPNFNSVKNRLPPFARTSAPAMKCPPVTVSLWSGLGPELSLETKWTPMPPQVGPPRRLGLEPVVEVAVQRHDRAVVAEAQVDAGHEIQLLGDAAPLEVAASEELVRA